MKRIVFALLAVSVWMGSGCTSSDRDYVRNHIVQVDSKRPHPETITSHATPLTFNEVR